MSDFAHSFIYVYFLLAAYSASLPVLVTLVSFFAPSARVLWAVTGSKPGHDPSFVFKTVRL
jgi:hypothetical protein